MVHKLPSRAQTDTTVRTLRLRLKDKHAKLLNSQAIEVNFVWNFTQELCLKHLERTGKFMSAFDVAAYVNSQPRPDFPGKQHDWPKGGKPADIPY